jgi:hypothetical protein
MTIGTSVFIIALGAILRWGVADRIDGVDLSIVGLILMIAGAVGLLAGLFLYSRGPRDEAIEERPRWYR